MRVSPVAKLPVLSQIFPSYIKTSYKSDPSVDHRNLPVIPVVHSKLQLAKHRREKFRHLDSCFPESVPVCLVHSFASAAAHAVKQDPDLHALSCFSKENLFNLLPEFITPDNIILDMDIISCMIHFI